MSLLFAATVPQRVQALVLYGSFARPSMLLADNAFSERIALIDRVWGTGPKKRGAKLPLVATDGKPHRPTLRQCELTARSTFAVFRGPTID